MPATNSLVYVSTEGDRGDVLPGQREWQLVHWSEKLRLTVFDSRFNVHSPFHFKDDKITVDKQFPNTL